MNCSIYPGADDYNTLNKVVTFAVGSNRAGVDVTIVDDLRFEENETFSVSLLSRDPHIAVDPSNSSAEITIMDDGCECVLTSW